MLIRESGMPTQAYWETLFDVPLILDAFGFTADTIGPIAELGCGYGTFTLPLAQRTRGHVYTFDAAGHGRPAPAALTTEAFVEDLTSAVASIEEPGRWKRGPMTPPCRRT